MLEIMIRIKEECIFSKTNLKNIYFTRLYYFRVLWICLQSDFGKKLGVNWNIQVWSSWWPHFTTLW